MQERKDGRTDGRLAVGALETEPPRYEGGRKELVFTPVLEQMYVSPSPPQDDELLSPSLSRPGPLAAIPAGQKATPTIQGGCWFGCNLVGRIILIWFYLVQFS